MRRAGAAAQARNLKSESVTLPGDNLRLCLPAPVLFTLSIHFHESHTCQRLSVALPPPSLTSCYE
jgi:hypothetical protein